MTGAEAVCTEIKNVDGILGAFVWHRSQCVASSLPKTYDTARLGQAGSGLWRTMLLARTAGYGGSPAAFHWQRVSLYGWAIGDEGLLGVVAHPKVPRSVLDLTATTSAAALLQVLHPTAADGPAPESAPGAPAAPVRLANLERALMGELGPPGRELLDRSVRRAWQPGVPESIWLPRLRAVVLAEVDDVAARDRLAESPWWD